MKKLEEKMQESLILYISINFIVTTLITMIIWPLLDYLLCNFITNSKFEYTISDYLFKPIMFA